MKETAISVYHPVDEMVGSTSICGVSSSASVNPSLSEYFTNLFITDLWPERWICGQWSPVEGWFYILSDLIIFLAYISIPFILVFHTWSRDLGKIKWLILLFASFITFCGLTHLIDAIMFWEPVYRLGGFVKFLTATISIGTSFSLALVLPKALKYKSPDELQREIDHRKAIQNQLELFVKFCPGAVAMVDTHMRYILVNDNWYRDYQLSSESIIGRNHYDVFPGIPEERREVHRRVLKGESLEKDFEQFGSDEAAIFVRWKLHPWRLPNNEIGGMIIFTEIITDEVRIREQLRERDKLLEQKHEQLQAALNELEAFSYSVSHDLRAPLRAINGFSEALMKDFHADLSDKAQHYLNRITANSHKMGKLIDELLAFSRIDRKGLQLREVDMNRLVSEIIEEYFVDAKSAIHVGNLPSVNCDLELIRQVWINLLSNAIKYSSTQPVPSIRVDALLENDSTIFRIQDNGVGFDMAYYDKLFKVFQRLHNDREFEGTGVGLALCHKIMKAHKGEIWAEAKINDGASFYLKFNK